MSVLKAEGNTFPTKTEVLIIGAGACGTIAALAAKERGAEVVILERDAKPSGSTSLSSGQIPAAGTKLQRAAGLLDDTPELLYKDILAKAHGECDHAIARLIAEESRNTVEWLAERHQVPLSCVLNFQYPGHSRPHMHAAKSLDGAELHAALLAAVERHEIALATAAHATDLYADADGRVRGVRVTRPDGKTEDIGCEALILACSGYGGNKEMLKKYIPDAADLFYEGHVGNQGDAVRWGEALGASIKDMGSFQGHGAMATPHGVHLNWATVTEGGFHVNVNGRRFSNENAGYSEQALKVHHQPGAVAWAIWDERSDAIAIQQASHKEAKDAGAIKRCDSVEAIARVVGCDPPALAQTFADVAALVRGEKRDEFGRDFKGKPPLKPPYCVSKIAGALTHTQGGLEVNTQMRVLQGRHAVTEPLRRRRRRARIVRAVGLGLSFRFRPDDRDQHGPPRRHCSSQPRQRITMIKFYYSTAPNPMKVALCLEEMGLAYEPIPVDTRKGAQHEPGYLAINPNAKVPSIVDGDVTMFDSNAIVLYLAEKTGRFLPKKAQERGPMLSWLMFVASGIGPFTGQYVHFKNYAPEKIAYALNRYEFEALRHWRIVDAHLAKSKYMVGDIYTVVDMALWGWARLLPNILGEQAAKFANVKRLVDEISARPAAQKAVALKDRYTFKTEMDDEAKRAMFPGNYRAQAGA